MRVYLNGLWFRRLTPIFTHLTEKEKYRWQSKKKRGISGFPVGVAGLGIYDPVRSTWLQTAAEAATARAETAEARAEEETIARQQEAARAETAEAELARLREELERLQARSN